MTENVLVTGAAGFIGSHVCEHLINENYNVWALDDLSGGFKDNVLPMGEAPIFLPARQYRCYQPRH